MATEERHDGPTPAGSAYSIAYWRGIHGEPVEKDQAVAVEIVEFSADGRAIARTHGRIGPARRTAFGATPALSRWTPRSGSSATATTPIAFPCDKTTAGPGARCGSGQETQILGRQGHPHQSCRAWLHHAGDVQDARVLLSRRAGRCCYFEPVTGELSDWMPTLEHFPIPKRDGGRETCRQRGPCSPPLQQDRLFDIRWAVIRERSRESQKSSRGGAPGERRRHQPVVATVARAVAHDPPTYRESASRAGLRLSGSWSPKPGVAGSSPAAPVCSMSKSRRTAAIGTLRIPAALLGAMIAPVSDGVALSAPRARGCTRRHAATTRAGAIPQRQR